MRRTAIRTTATIAVVLGFASVLASIVVDGPAKQWFTLVGYGLLAIGIVIGVAQRAHHARESSSELSASDEYSDLQLGRRPITHYPREDASTSQIGDPPQDSPPLP